MDIAFPAVAKGDQTLTGFQYSASSVTFGSAAPTVTAPSGVQTTLSYSATPSAVCTVNSPSGALTIVGVGSCEITATAASTANYNEATAEYTVTVQTAGTLVLNLSAIATDNTVNDRVPEKVAKGDQTLTAVPVQCLFGERSASACPHRHRALRRARRP